MSPLILKIALGLLIFNSEQLNGMWKKIEEALVERGWVQEGRVVTPIGGCTDSQTVKVTEYTKIQG